MFTHQYNTPPPKLIKHFRYIHFLLKRKLENIFIYPFIAIGQCIATFKKQPSYKIYFFFPFYHTGGAEMVHAQITQACGNKDVIIYFTRKSTDKRFLAEFQKSECVIKDISAFTDNKWLYPINLIYRGYISSMINKQKTAPSVFNGQCNFAYKISPWINQNIKQIELIHSFNTFSWIRIPFIPFIHQTVMISKLRLKQHLEQYRNLGIPSSYYQRIQFVQNAIHLPQEACNRTPEKEIKILFVGRGTPEKRPELFVQIATEAYNLGITAKFTLVGDMNNDLLTALPPNTIALGNISDEAILHSIYCQHNILIIPSYTEGFPIVLMEAMARGCMVMATAVGDIPYHIQHRQNGLLFSSIHAEIVEEEAIIFLKSVTTELLQQLCTNAKQYAHEHFGIEHFNTSYRSILQ